MYLKPQNMYKKLINLLKLITVFFLLIASNRSSAAIYTVGTGGNYTSLYAAFDDVNNGAITGDIVFQIRSNLVEVNSCVLDYSGFGGSYTKILIYPTAPNLSITGSLGGLALIDFNGADNVTIDGRVNATGSTTSLLIHNTYSGIVSGTTNAVKLRDNAQFNVIQYCDLATFHINTSYPIMLNAAAGGQAGNSNNRFSYNKIHGGSTTNIRACIYSEVSTASNNRLDTIANCDLYNAYEATIFLKNGTDGWNISNNSIYQPTAFTNVQFQYSLLIEATNTNATNRVVINNNFIGGSAPLCAGAAFTFAGANANKSYNGMKTVSGAAGISITNNTIKNILINNTTKTGNLFFAIENSNGKCFINGNTIGSSTGNGSITINSIGNVANITRGIYNFGNDSVVITNNIIGSIKTTNANLNESTISLIEKDGTGYFDIKNNNLGSSSTLSSIEAQSSTGFAQNVIGIFNKNGSFGLVRDNTIKNMYNGCRKTVTTAGGSVVGVYMAGGSGEHVVLKNTISDLYSGSPYTDEFLPPAVGIYSAGDATYRVIEKNSIFNIADTNSANAAVFATGISIGTSSGVQHFVRSNFIADIFTSSTIGAALGIQAVNMSNSKLENNIITMGETLGKAYGIKTNSNSNTQLLYNTVYISSSATTNNQSACLLVTHASVSQVQNNIFVNTKANASGVTKTHFCVINTTATAFPSINYNNYRAVNTSTGAAIGLLNVTNYTNMAQWRVGTVQELNGLNIDPMFANAGGQAPLDYYPSATLPAIVIATTTDFLGNLRSTTAPRMGALEFNFTVPVTWKSFIASKETNGTLLKWITATEQNTLNYEVEKSTNTRTWKIIATLPAANNATTDTHYETIDSKILFGTTYYRIKQVDVGGRFSYSIIQQVTRNATGDFAIFPNPALDYLNVKIPNNAAMKVEIYSTIGQLVFKTFINQSSNINISNLVAGNYLLKCYNSTQSKTTQFTKR